MQYPALLLNATYEPLRVISWKKAIILVLLGKVEVLKEYEREIRGVSIRLKLPSVIRLLKYVKGNHNWITFSRQNVYLRDGFRCQYCGREFPSEELTCDHVIPRSRGGITDWSNVVTCCKSCNTKKGDRTPEEAGMRLLREPKRPVWLPFVHMSLKMEKLPSAWAEYLFVDHFKEIISRI
jgi:5-methylcytosine-specific restriction endonuclease McrA